MTQGLHQLCHWPLTYHMIHQTRHGNVFWYHWWTMTGSYLMNLRSYIWDSILWKHLLNSRLTHSLLIPKWCKKKMSKNWQWKKKIRRNWQWKKGARVKTVMSSAVQLFCYQPLYFAPGNKTHMSLCNFGDLGALSNKKNSLLIFDQSSLKEGKNNGRVHFQDQRFSVAPSLR